MYQLEEKIWFWVWLLKIVALAAAGQFSSLLSFFSIPDLKRLSLGIGGVTAGLLVLWNVNDLTHQMSRGAIILDGMASFLGLSMTRLAFRLVRQGGDVGNDGGKTVVGIVGAGELGAALAQDLRLKTEIDKKNNINIFFIKQTYRKFICNIWIKTVVHYLYNILNKRK